VSYTQRDEVANKCPDERLGMPGQGQLDAREAGSGGIAGVEDEELPSYRSVIATCHFVPRVSARRDRF
jgi:hypothetical protein